jgi:hypothetical protein
MTNMDSCSRCTAENRPRCLARDTRSRRLCELVDPAGAHYQPEYERLVFGEAPKPVATAGGDPGPPSIQALVSHAESCPHREPFPAERPSCQCSHHCKAGQSKRQRGGVTLMDCWGCKLRPGVALPVAD